MSGDRLQIHELINLAGHLMDEGAFQRLDEIFTDDVLYDVSALGGGELVGPEAIADAGKVLGDRNPIAHHVTNVVVERIGNDVAHAISKGPGVMADGSVGSVVYEDDVRRTPAGWRIVRRRVLPRRKPLQPNQ
jgi:hypothetical protein